MNKILFVIACFLFSAVARTQELNEISFKSGINVGYYSFRTDQGILIRVSEDGKLLEWGTPYPVQGYNAYSGKLQQYTGRVDYYKNEFDSILNGKVRSIGTATITYYGSSETDAKKGKVRSIGRSNIDYFENYENVALRGKIKQAGLFTFSYYQAYENEAFRGKLKSVGTTTITYYSSFDDKNTSGKLKSIGSTMYTWYTQTDGRGYPGSYKSGPLQQSISGINYIIIF